MEIEANGWTFHVVVGRLDQGNFICIPNWNIGGELAGPGDVHWNAERLLQTTPLHPDNVKAVVSGIAEAARLKSIIRMCAANATQSVRIC